MNPNVMVDILCTEEDEHEGSKRITTFNMHNCILAKRKDDPPAFIFKGSRDFPYASDINLDGYIIAPREQYFNIIKFLFREIFNDVKQKLLSIFSYSKATK